MKITTQLAWWKRGQTVVPVTIGIASGAALLGGLAFSAVAMLFGGAVVCGLGYLRLFARQQQRLLQRAARELFEAFDDPHEARARFDQLERAFRGRNDALDRYLTRMSAVALLAEERWSEARAVLEGVDAGRLFTADQRATYENNLAWALAHDGAPKEAAVIVERARAREVRPAPTITTHLDATLGVALVLDGRQAAAVPLLRSAIEAGGGPTTQAYRHYYLGIALVATGAVEEARHAWEQTRMHAPTSSWAKRAEERLAADPPHAYR